MILTNAPKVADIYSNPNKANNPSLSSLMSAPNISVFQSEFALGVCFPAHNASLPAFRVLFLVSCPLCKQATLISAVSHSEEAISCYRICISLLTRLAFLASFYAKGNPPLLSDPPHVSEPSPSTPSSPRTRLIVHPFKIHLVLSD